MTQLGEEARDLLLSMSPFPCHSQIDILEESIKNRPYIDKSHENLQTK